VAFCTSTILLAPIPDDHCSGAARILFTPEGVVADRRPGVIAMIMAPLMFWLLHTIGSATGNPFLPERESY
jgi:hypothetical protein